MTTDDDDDRTGGQDPATLDPADTDTADTGTDRAPERRRPRWTYIDLTGLSDEEAARAIRDAAPPPLDPGDGD